jgi:membrane-bound inhibitor of C-type lysozyme
MMDASSTKDPKMKASFLIVPAAILAGCATITGKATERRVVYACNYGPNLTVTYAPSVARIQSADGTVTLRQRSSASGFWYESATHSLRGSDREITYKDRQMAPRLCRPT